MWKTHEIKIGTVLLPSRLFLAPMAGISDMALRQVAKEYGAGLTCTEMICAEGIVRHQPKTLKLIAISPKERPTAIQLFGRDPDVIAHASQIAEATADIIDLNFGCPARNVVRSGSGAALLRQPETIRNITDKVVKSVSCPVTAKIRSGWDKNTVNAVEVARIIEDSGATAVAIHPRLRSQGFSGLSNWQIIADVKNAVSIPVIGNGDVRSPEDAKAMLEMTGCDCIMIGRGALGNPWIFSRTIHCIETGILPPPPSLREKLQHLLKFARSLVELKGENVACREIRKFIKWYTKGMPNVAELRSRAMHVESLKELEDLVTHYMEMAISFQQSADREVLIG